MSESRPQTSTDETDEAADIREYSAVAFFPSSVAEMRRSSFPEGVKTLDKNMRTLRFLIRISESLSEQRTRKKLKRLTSALRNPNVYHYVETEHGFPKFRKTIFCLLQPDVCDALHDSSRRLQDADEAALSAAWNASTDGLKVISDQFARVRERKTGDADIDAAVNSLLDQTAALVSSVPNSYDQASGPTRADFRRRMNLQMTAFVPTLQELRDMSERLADEAGGFGEAAYLDNWVREAITADAVYATWQARGAGDTLMDAFGRSVVNLIESFVDASTSGTDRTAT